MKNSKFRFTRPLVGAGLLMLSVGAASLWLSGCSGGSGSKNPYFNQNSGLFVSADQPTGNGMAHTFIELNNGVPVRQGMEFTPAALEGFPTEPPNNLTVPFIGPMPTKTNGSPFTNVFLAYLTSHPATHEPAHFHLAILIRSALVTAEPFLNERAPVAPDELPPRYVRSFNTLQPNGIVVAGGGVIYDDPTLPAGEPAATTLGQNYLYYQGHMNGMVLGPTIEQLKSKKTMVMSIGIPEVFPRDGYYPTAWGIRYDEARGVHVLEMANFVRAPKFAQAGS